MKDDYLKIVNRYGINTQQRKLEEEVFELNEAISLHNATGGYYKNIIEEIGDVLNVLNSIMAYYGIEEDELTEIMKFKVQRQLQRMENENVF